MFRNLLSNRRNANTLILALAISFLLPGQAALAYGSDVSTSGQAIESGHTGAYVPGNSADDSTTTYWVSNSTTGFIGQDLGASYTICRASRYVYYLPNNVEVVLEYSDDNSNWTQAASSTKSTGSWFNDDLGAGISARYWRWRPASSAGDFWYMAEIELLPCDPTATPTNTQTPTITSTATATLTATATWIATVITATFIPTATPAPIQSVEPLVVMTNQPLLAAGLTLCALFTLVGLLYRRLKS